MVRGFISESFRGTFLQGEIKHTEALLGRALPHRQLINSHAHVILELLAPNEVRFLRGLSLSASSSSQEFSGLTRSRYRQSTSNTPSYRCCCGSLLTSSANCTMLPVNRSGPAMNSLVLKVQMGAREKF